MPVSKSFAGTTYQIPLNKDPKSTNWGTQVSNFLQALADYALPRTGGSNQLTAELNLAGSGLAGTYGIKLPYLKSATADGSLPAAGFLRLGNGESIQWKGSSSDLSLAINGSDRLLFNSTLLYQPADAASANTVSKLVLRDSNGDFSAGTITATSFNGPITGNAATASKWLTARTITLGTDLTGSVSIDGSADVTLNATIAANSVALGTDTTGDYVSTITGTANQVTVTGGTGESSTPVLSLPQDIASTSSPTFANVTISNIPTNSTHAATKGYVDTIAQGLDVKASVKAATTANITLSGTQTIDGVALSVDDRVLVKNQSTQADNGFYLVKSLTWQRTTDADVWDELIGAFVFVEQGTTLADTGWVCTVNAGGTLGSTAVTFSQFSGVGSYQPLDATLTALAAYNTNGFIVQTATDTFAGRSLAAGTGISITNTDGFSGNPSIAIDSTVATLTGSQTLTNKTLDAAIIDNAALMLHETSVSTPSSGRIALYPKSDNKLYIKDSTGVETAVGTGSGGGVINYILNPDAESNTTGWATYADAAGTTPVDGTGGSPSVTWTRNTTTPLRGNADFAFAKDAANRQGQGVSYDFTISSVDKGRKLSVSFDYNSNTTNYSAGDILVYLYDVTNSILITPSSTSLPKNTGTLTVSFDSTTSTSYRLILHVSTTNATAYTLYFENFQVGPGQIVQGAAISEWQTFTMVIEGSTSNPTKSSSPTTDLAVWRRVGSSMEIMYTYVQTNNTGAASGSGAYFFNMPSGYNIDNSKVGTPSIGGDGDAVLGEFRASDGTNRYNGVVQRRTNVNKFVLQAANDANADGAIGSTRVPLGGAAATFTFTAMVPIAEWASNGTVSLGAGAQVEYAYNSSTSTTANDASSFAYGPQGAKIQAITAALNRTVRFQYPIQTDDILTLQVSGDQRTWLDLDSIRVIGGSGISPYVTQNGAFYGAGIYSADVNGTDVTVRFGTYEQPTSTYGAAGEAWRAGGSDQYWRVRKAKASSPVGFGLVTGTDSGLMKATSSLGLMRYNTSNGYGSTNTAIRRFSTLVSNTSSVTYADTAANGTSFTITESGVYAITYGDSFSGTAWFGLSLNSSQLTTNIANITAANRLVVANASAANLFTTVSWVGYLASGDILRPHSDATTSGASTTQSTFTIQRIA